MRLHRLPGAPEFTYCTNIHAGESWADISASLDAHVPRIRTLTAPDVQFGLGLRLSGIAAAELEAPDALARFRDQLHRLGAYVFTVNAFPYGPFHGTRVKEEVYAPDWRAAERLAFTGRAARILAALLPEGGYGSISTVPGAFKPNAVTEADRTAIAENLLKAAADLVHLSHKTGRTIALALEPEPFCMLETVEETLSFFEERLFSRAGTTHFAALSGLAGTVAEGTLRRHLGVCYDVCHGAVEFEDPVAAMRALRRAGIAIPKIQLSSAMRVSAIDDAAVAELHRYDTGVYLHQVSVRGDTLTRYRDLPDAFSAWHAGKARGEWRIHCHLPVFLDEAGLLRSTRPDLLSVLAALREEALSPHLEVETYTWDVLPEALKTASKADDIAREMNCLLEELGYGSDDRRASALAGDAVPARPGL